MSDSQVLLPASTSPYILERKVTAQGKYQALGTITYTNPRDETKKQREHEVVFLVGRSRSQPVGALMPNIYRDSSGLWNTVLVQQFRPQYEKDTIEFPAGFIDHRRGERADQAAVREMEEETTKTGKPRLISPPLTSDPISVAAQLTGVLIHAEDKGGAEKGKQRLDKGEFAEEHVVPLIELEEQLRRFESQGVLIDPRVWTFAVGIHCAQTLGLHQVSEPTRE